MNELGRNLDAVGQSLSPMPNEQNQDGKLDKWLGKTSITLNGQPEHASQLRYTSGVTMFINRIPELGIIEASFNGVLKQRDHTRPSILDFYGVKGIGKTALLQKFTEKLSEDNIKYIEVKFDENASVFYKRMQDQLQKYVPIESLDTEEQGVYETAMQQVKELLEQGPLVLILDAVGTTNESQVEYLEAMFSKLVIYQTLFVVLSSQQRINFENERSVRHKLTTHLVEPFDEESCYTYLQQFDPSLNTEQYTRIFEWTHGYPLAINEMVSALYDSLDPTDEEGRKQLAQRIVDRVVRRGLLARVKSDEQEWYLSMLNLLAVPRRFSLITLQQLIEQFKPDDKLATSLSYLVLPKRMKRATGVMSWDMAKSGFTIDEPVRHILLLNLKINHNDFYLRLHQYLAQLNQQNAAEAQGHERILYQREYLYHSACSLDTSELEGVLAEANTEITHSAEGQLYWLVQFLEEFDQDKELQQVLSSRVSILTNPFYQALAQKMDELYRQETHNGKGFDYLRSFFYYTAKNTAIEDKVSILARYVNDVLLREGRESVIQLSEKLGEDVELRNAMGQDFALLLAAIHHMTASEG